jgi:hypothetical protein
MSISPAQKRAKPSPVPGPSTVIATPGFASLNAACAAAEIGSTVDEPEIEISPSTPVGISYAGAAASVPMASVPAGSVAGGSVVANATCADAARNRAPASAEAALPRRV